MELFVNGEKMLFDLQEIKGLFYTKVVNLSILLNVNKREIIYNKNDGVYSFSHNGNRIVVTNENYISKEGICLINIDDIISLCSGSIVYFTDRIEITI